MLTSQSPLHYKDFHISFLSLVLCTCVSACCQLVLNIIIAIELYDFWPQIYTYIVDPYNLDLKRELVNH